MAACEALGRAAEATAYPKVRSALNELRETLEGQLYDLVNDILNGI
jgi:hypothetical protein